MPPDEDEIRVLELRNIRLHRLHLLERRQSMQGLDTPPDVLIEIEQTRRELRLADSAAQGIAANAATDGDIVEELGPSGRFWAHNSEIRLAQQQIAQLAKQFDERFASIEWAIRLIIMFIGGLLVVLIIALALAIAFRL